MTIRTLWDVLSVSVVGLYGITLLLFLRTYDVSHLISFLGLFLTIGISEGLKLLCRGSTCPRPFGAENCNTFCSDGNQEGRPGMPSTHAAFVTFFVTYYAPVLSSPLRALATLYAAAVIYSRYAKKCHSAIQLASGFALGGGMGMIANVLFSNIQGVRL
jgi:membrane-associated phospholipid phosphatase